MSSSEIEQVGNVGFMEDNSGPRLFESLLYDGAESGNEMPEEPTYFTDLNFGQVVNSLYKGREDYNLAPFFYTRAPDLDTVAFRQEVFRDLQDHGLLTAIGRFAAQMRRVRMHLNGARTVRYRYQKEGFFLDAAKAYCSAVTALEADLDGAALASRGMQAFHRHLRQYLASDAFEELQRETNEVAEALAQVIYTVTIQGSRVTVSRYQDEPDYSAEIAETFERFKRGAVKDYRVGFRDLPEMNHVEAQISELVAKLFPEVFGQLESFCNRHAHFRNPKIDVFDREVQFYTAYLEYTSSIASVGLSFCFPEVTDRSKDVFANETFDLALANKIAATKNAVVTNDFYLKDQERIIIVSGPNQGGKTTFARTFAQLHHLANIGCPVPGRSARLFHCDQIFTQFEKEEDLGNLAGKLETDLSRIHQALDMATTNSVVVLNEVFSSTTLQDARFLGQRILERMIELDLLVVYVTFIDELASMPKTVSMISTIVPEDPAVRTFKVVRGEANGLAYAMAIAEKHGVTYERLRERLSQ